MCESEYFLSALHLVSLQSATQSGLFSFLAKLVTL